jgi:hypothetical protein
VNEMDRNLLQSFDIHYEFMDVSFYMQNFFSLLAISFLDTILMLCDVEENKRSFFETIIGANT